MSEISPNPEVSPHERYFDSELGDTLETIYNNQLSQRLPYVVRVVIPQNDIMRALDAMHTWALIVSGGGYAASPFREFSDSSTHVGYFKWHFKSAVIARQFAAQFSGDLVL